ncbi:hypothetical protein [Mesorhizobium sp.]|uniref:hypothetical protein n=1 Tax=Mesorhizobium sp. TaxID=1871066 RepID=UPI0025CE9383|nr:hypothetical protein [Mesorhizobium sp.]
MQCAIRAVALTRKNALLAGHEVGAENWELLASIVAICKLNDVNPAACIAETLQAILNGYPQRPRRAGADLASSVQRQEGTSLDSRVSVASSE